MYFLMINILVLVLKQIRDINVRRVAFDTIVIKWLSDDFDEYQILYWPLNDEKNKILQTTSTNNFTLTAKSNAYKFQIRAHTKLGWTFYSEERLISLDSISIDKSSALNLGHNFVDNKYILFAGPLIILALLGVVIILAIIYLKK